MTCKCFPAVLVFAAMASAHAAGKGALQLPDYYRVMTLQSPAISPDGRRVAFVRTHINEAANRRQEEIWLSVVDGSEPPSRIADAESNASSPRWSWDGKLLAYSSRPGGGTRGSQDEGASIRFLRMDQPGTAAFEIPGVQGASIFSPDNRWIAFTKKIPAPKPEPRDATEWERLIHERFKGKAYDWMNIRFDQRGYLPDPRDPSATPPEELFIVPREGGLPRQLTHTGVSVKSPTWRPDSGALAFSANAHQRDEYLYERSDLWTVTIDGRVTRLTDDGFDNESPAWSPDGRAIVFIRQESLNLILQTKQSHGSPVDVYRIASDGGTPQNLTPDWDLLPGPPGWSPDGRFIYFTGGIGGSQHLFRVPAAGGETQQITTGDRHLAGFTPSASYDRMAYTSTDPTHPDELFASQLDGREERRLTHFNDAFVDDVAPVPAERMLYPSKDGTEIEGWVLVPRDYEAAKGPYPLILATHGGPHGAYGNEFSFQFQLWAANGFIVLYTNPRGSTNYGEKFLWSTWGGWGVLDYDDVMAGVDYVRTKYAVDDKRMGVTGYSYGGFLTNWIIGHTTRFAAAVVGAGISNWISDYGTADIPRTKESEFFGPPWEPKSRELLTRLSPLTYVGNVATPTLFVHGESDYRVPIEEGEQMYTALKKRRVPSRFVRYPDSYHGGWTPWNTVHRYYEEMKWWEKYLSPKRSAPTMNHMARD